MTGPDARLTAETVWRMESASVVAVASRVLGDVGLGEEVAQDAFVAALEQWPSRGVPPNPAGWLVSTARHQAIDLVRRRSTYARKLAEVGRTVTDARLDGSGRRRVTWTTLLDDHIGDDLLRLVFTTCHPVLTTESRVALTLRLLGGLTTAEVARGLLIPEATAGQRISRAKRTLATRGRLVRAAPGAGDAGAARVGPRGRLPDVQRGVRRHVGSRLGAARAVPRGDPAGPPAGVAAPGGA